MTDEQRDQLWSIVKLVVVGLFACCYAYGGMGELWMRRFLGPVILSAFMLLYNRSAWHLVALPLICLALTLPYGSDIVYIKVLLRGIYGLSVACATGFMLIFLRRWVLSIFHVVLAMSACIVFGVINPFNSARIEETIIGVCLCLIPVMSIKKYSE